MEVKKRILIVEDNPDVIEMIRMMLEGLGYAVNMARNGREGVEMASQERPDLIVMDILMPIMDGFEAISRIKKNPRTRTIPILAATALPGDRERSLANGCDGYVNKPFTRGQLKAAIDALFSKQESLRLSRLG
ncbi:MAG: response regulator [Deltaproteobacteria bacterium]|nr:response regulator [Deltaproteobacteria bacterium]